MRYLAIDLGDKRTGLALGDDVTRLVSPVKVLDVPRGPLLLDALAKAVDEQRPDAVVIGLPINMDGTEGPAAKSTREFAGQIQSHIQLEVHFQDERLTSYAAEQHLNQSGRTRKEKKQLRDALAACEVLKDFLDARG